MNLRISEIISESIKVKQQLLEDKRLLNIINDVADICTIALKTNKKILLCGNGGSASDAQHIAAELTGRFYLNRDPFFAEALHVNTSYLTAVANDYSFDEIYARQIQAKAESGDILIAISTSGNSNNILRAIEQAKSQGVIVIGLAGLTGGKMKALVDYLINIPSTDTPRIQEAHILVGHIICELVEKYMVK